MEILELSQTDGFKKIATWDTEHGINATRSQSDIFSQISASLQNRTIIVASRIGMPYLGHAYINSRMLCNTFLYDFFLFLVNLKKESY